MTPEEAITRIKQIRPPTRYTLTSDALDLAISALEQNEILKTALIRARVNWITSQIGDDFTDFSDVAKRQLTREIPEVRWNDDK